jgi:tRNA threonylcarbamoyladenosine biosynthesis protein TsaE
VASREPVARSATAAAHGTVPRAAGPAILTEEQLVAWGRRIGRTVATPVFLALRGDLGAGKSVLARAIARGAGVTSPMPSPTFNLVFRYGGAGRNVSHLDLYRLEDPEEVWELGWRELGAEDEIVIVEWPERAEPLLPPDRWDVQLRPGPDASLRDVRAQPCGAAPPLPDLPTVTPPAGASAAHGDR